MGNPKRHRQEVRALVHELNELVDVNERNALRQEQIMRRLRALGALDDMPVPYSVVRRGQPGPVIGTLSAKPDGSLS
jgi:hypothetical protein